jgi:hypothetical protein
MNEGGRWSIAFVVLFHPCQPGGTVGLEEKTVPNSGGDGGDGMRNDFDRRRGVLVNAAAELSVDIVSGGPSGSIGFKEKAVPCAAGERRCPGHDLAGGV